MMLRPVDLLQVVKMPPGLEDTVVPRQGGVAAKPRFGAGASPQKTGLPTFLQGVISADKPEYRGKIGASAARGLQ